VQIMNDGPGRTLKDSEGSGAVRRRSPRGEKRGGAVSNDSGMT